MSGRKEGNRFVLSAALLAAVPILGGARSAQEPDAAPVLLAVVPQDAQPASGAGADLDGWTLLMADEREAVPLGERLDAFPGGAVHLVGPAGVVTAAAAQRGRLASLVLLARGATALAPGAPGSLAGLPVAVLVAGEPGAPPPGLDALVADLRARGADPVRALFRPIGADRLPGLADPALARELHGFRRLARERARRAAVDRVLDDLHAAAAEPDGARYFAHFAPDAVFVGTDATERWSVAEFRAYAEPFFSQGRGWRYVSTERHVAFGASGDVAWFDERLHNEKYGETRGSGVLVRRGDRWLVAQYVLSIPVPNELAADLVERIRALGK